MAEQSNSGELMSDFTDNEITLIGSYHDNRLPQALREFIDDEGELARLNAHRNESRSMESFNRIIREAIRI